MMIANDAELRQYIPNALVTVSGEQSLYDKLQVELQLSETWFARIFGVVESTPTACKIIATDAFIRAIPSLDLVLTANGFGIVSNNTIAPASRDRVDRLLSSLEQNRDFAIDQLLHELLQSAEWRTTPQGKFFTATLFPKPLAFPDTLYRGKAWVYFEQVHASLVLIEQELAEKFISREVYARLRCAVEPTDDEQALIVQLQAIELDLLQGKPLPYKDLVMIVEYIRSHEEIFPEWQTSRTAELYKPHAFQNEKSSTAYWF